MTYTIKRFKEDSRFQIQELMDNPLDWKLSIDSSDYFSAEFSLDNDLDYSFDAHIIKSPPLYFDPTIDVWVVEFEATEKIKYNPTFDITGTGQEFVVFATIADIFKSFIRRLKPEAFFFSAKEQSRAKLYTVFAKKIAKETNYDFSIETEHETLFLFTRK